MRREATTRRSAGSIEVLSSSAGRCDALFAAVLVCGVLLAGAPLLAQSAEGSRAPAAQGDDHDHEHGDGHDHEHAGAAGAGAATPLGILGTSAIRWLPALADAAERVRGSGRLVLVDFGAEWCGWCKRLDRETFGAEEVIRFVSQECEAVRVDIDAEPGLAKRFEVQGVPAVLFLRLDASGVDSTPAGGDADVVPEAPLAWRRVGRIDGFLPPDRFLEQARVFVDQARSLEALAVAAAAHPSDVAAQEAYGRALLANGQREAGQAFLRQALERLPQATALRRLLADAHYEAEEFKEAAFLYRIVLGEGEDGPEKVAGEVRRGAFLPLASCLMSLGARADAEEVLGELLAGVERRLERAVAAPGGPEEDAAAEAGEAAAAPAPSPLAVEELEGLFLRAYLRALGERPQEALEDLRLAERADPDGPWGLRAGFIIARLER